MTQRANQSWPLIYKGRKGVRIRTRCLRSSWADLVGFWGSVMRELEDTYHATVERKAPYCPIPSADALRIRSVGKHEFEAALVKLDGARR